MESLFLLIPIALVFCAIAIKLLLWAIDSGQYDDLDKESWRILNDDDAAPPSASGSATDSGVGATSGAPSEPPGGADDDRQRPGGEA